MDSPRPMTVRRSLGWTAIGQVTFFAVQFGATVVLARLLSPHEMGVFAVGMAILGLISSIESFGMIALVVREPEMDEEVLATAFTINLALSAAIAILTLLMSGPAAAFFHQPGVGQVMAPLAAATLLGVLEFRPNAMLQRNMRFRALAAITMTKAVVTSGATIALAFAGYSYMSLAWGLLAGGLASALLANLVGRRYASLRLSLVHWRRLTGFGVQMLFIAGLSNVGARVAELVCGRMLGLAALGVFSRASNLTNQLFANIHVVAGKVVFADFAEQQRQEGSLRLRYLRTLEIATGLLWPMFIGLAVLARPAVDWLYGERWRAAALPLSLLCVASAVLVAVSMAWEVFVVRHETRRQVRIEAVRTGVGLALFSAGCLISIGAAAAARLGEALVTFVLYRPHLARMTDTSNADIVPLFARGALLTALAVGPAVAFMHSQAWSYSPSPLLTAGAVLAGVLAWTLGLKLLKHPIYDEGARLAAKLPRARFA